MDEWIVCLINVEALSALVKILFTIWSQVLVVDFSIY
jgi:hypothetical protein